MTSTVMVVTELGDTTADSVIEHLHSTGMRVARLDLVDFPGRVDFEITETGLGSLATPTRTVFFNDVRAVYWRRPTPVSCQYDDPAVAEFAEREARAGFVAALKALPCLHVNYPDFTRRAENKPLQLQHAGRLGFAVPATTITNRPARAQSFAQRHGPVVYKSLRPPEIDRDGEPLAIWAGTVAPEEITGEVAATAHQFQAQVDKIADIRLTAIGRELFAVRIDSDVLDWRSDYDQLRYEPVEVPEDVSKAVRRYLDGFSLHYGCFDFALTAAGTWVFLECNPAGQWAWLEDETGLPMAKSFAELLARGMHGIR
ncbi:ATP-grasp ribosomal peptide maturase [Glycomyces xiaoerkulensis]|uniref:ATP-grasp ribosomal peptide maturase n=1 Tax=Glycomyces xiaoerkulensis TaxID=2038139 RepID=UPI000C26B237|nr:ATP-grasp ribosomal peptide maturase [Glycomyces xiaoerkulensis]